MMRTSASASARSVAGTVGVLGLVVAGVTAANAAGLFSLGTVSTGAGLVIAIARLVVIVSAGLVVAVAGLVVAIAGLVVAVSRLVVIVSARLCGRGRRSHLGVTAHATTILTGTTTLEGGDAVVLAIHPDAATIILPAAGTGIEVVGGTVEVPKGEKNVGGTPLDGTIEIGGTGETCILPVVEDIVEVGIATLPVEVIGTAGGDIEEILEVDLIDLVELIRGKIEFVGHLVTQKICLFLGLAERQDASGEGVHSTYGYEEEGENITFHISGSLEG